MKRRIVCSLTCAAFILNGCYEPFSNEDLEFLLSTPQALSIDVPATDTQSLRAAQTGVDGPAKFYRDTLKSAREINDGIFAFLDIVEFISAFPPTIREDDRRIWGPFPADDNPDNTLEIALIIDRSRTATVARFVSTATAAADVSYTYSLVARPIGTGDDAWLAILGGQSHPRPEGDDGQTGRMVVSLENLRILDPANNTDRGIFFVGYDTRFNRKTIQLFADGDAGPEFEVTAAFVHNEEQDGTGSFIFAVVEDQLKNIPGDEILYIGSRWLLGGRGRADVAITSQGRPNRPARAFAAVSECWNNDFERVFLVSFPQVAEFMPVGTVEDCGPDLLQSNFPDD